MTLTEEQLEAIRDVSDLPRAIGCTQCHSYIQEHYGNQFAILRAMIDSSEQFGKPTELIGGIDLEKGRATLEEAIERMRMTVCDEDGFVWEADPEQTAILQEMLDRIGRYTNNDYLDLQYQLDGAEAEIERLRADYDKLKSSLLVIDGCKKLMNQAARIDELEADNQNLVTLNKSLMNNDWILRDNNRKYRKRAQKAELLNKELKADLEQSERVVEARLEVIDQQAAQIRELEKNCIYDPEQGKIFVPHGYPELEKLRARVSELEDAHKRSGAKYAKIINELRSSVYAKIPSLQKQWNDVLADGKIGPDADAKPHCWQITEERNATLAAALKVLERLRKVNTDTDHSYLNRGIVVLRAMLTEAGQE